MESVVLFLPYSNIPPKGDRWNALLALSLPVELAHRFKLIPPSLFQKDPHISPNLCFCHPLTSPSPVHSLGAPTQLPWTCCTPNTRGQDIFLFLLLSVKHVGGNRAWGQRALGSSGKLHKCMENVVMARNPKMPAAEINLKQALTKDSLLKMEDSYWTNISYPCLFSFFVERSPFLISLSVSVFFSSLLIISLTTERDRTLPNYWIWEK